MSAMLHPLTLVSLALLVMNDHFLKWAHPSWLTGKLSDVAGMILAPIVLSVATRHKAPTMCALAVAFVFALTKTWSPANHVWCATLGPLVKDPTDLIALPFAALAVIVARRSRSARGAAAA
ncbi:MAG TPA: hypothetical protein VH054_11945 [Polyangiaceae bacterium]|nr:hypothetical protein [Polyangiaceae bacterium]